MTSSEWIELFFSEAYEKQINNLVLEDWDYDVPILSIRNYVEQIIAIPYTEFIAYVKEHFAGATYRATDIPQFIKYSNCEINLVNYLLGEDNRGCTPTEIGEELNDLFEKNVRGNASYATRHLGSAKMLGLAYEYFGHWYLNCLSYAYVDLNKEEREAMVARAMLRSPFFKAVFASSNRRIVLSDFLNRFSPIFARKHFLSVVRLIDICINEAQRSGRKILFDSRLADRKPLGDIFNIDSIAKPFSTRSLMRYVEEVKGWYSMSEKDARRLVDKHRKGDRNALEELVKAAQPIVIRNASELDFAPKEDIIQEGNLGLLAGIENFELDRRVSLFGYLSFWVKRYLQSYKDSLGNLVRIPINKFTLINSVKEQAKQYLQNHGYMPPCEELDWGLASEEESKIAYNIMMSMEEYDSQTTTIEEDTLYADDKVYSPERTTDLESLNFELHHLIHFLSMREEIIVLDYFGMDGRRSETFESIGSKLGLTRERIRQIYEKSIRKLRILAKAKNGVGTLNEKEREELTNMIKNGARAFREDVRERAKEKIYKKYEPKPQRTMELTALEGRDDTAGNKAHNAIVPSVTARSSVANSPAKHEANVGDKILYNGNACVVLEKIPRGDSFRLSIRYEDGRIDNIQDDMNKYSIIKKSVKERKPCVREDLEPSRGNDKVSRPSKTSPQEDRIKEDGNAERIVEGKSDEIEHVFLNSRGKVIGKLMFPINSENRSGKPWSSEEEKLISIFYSEGQSFSEIAKAIGRTEVAVMSRLGMLGLIDYSYGQEYKPKENETLYK
jgi:RNA polymerase primary sigma factor